MYTSYKWAGVAIYWCRVDGLEPLNPLNSKKLFEQFVLLGTLCDTRILRVHSWPHVSERVMSHMWTSHVAHANESCRTCERVITLDHTSVSATEPRHTATHCNTLQGSATEWCHTCTMSMQNESRTRTCTPKYTLTNLCMHNDSPTFTNSIMHIS